jgi:hypothetical protein
MNPNINRYTLIAYKPDSADYCRGCHMASYSSDLIIYNSLDVNKIIDKMVELNSRIELNDNCNEEGYEFSIYKNGIIISGDDVDGEDGSSYLEEEAKINTTDVFDIHPLTGAPIKGVKFTDATHYYLVNDPKKTEKVKPENARVEISK